jgi:hypothetical protein
MSSDATTALTVAALAPPSQLASPAPVEPPPPPKEAEPVKAAGPKDNGKVVDVQA